MCIKDIKWIQLTEKNVAISSKRGSKTLENGYNSLNYGSKPAIIVPYLLGPNNFKLKIQTARVWGLHQKCAYVLHYQEPY